MTTYRAALIGCGRIGAFIDNEVVGSRTPTRTPRRTRRASALPWRHSPTSGPT